VDVLLRQRPLSIFCTCAVFVVTGVSSDNIFVVHETWQQAYSLRTPDGAVAPRAERVRWTLAQATRPLFVADITTAFSLFVNCLSPLPAIAQFGLCGGVLIIINFVLVLLYMPALLVLDERGAFRAGRLALPHFVRSRLRKRAPTMDIEETTAAGMPAHSQTSSRLIHALHGALYRHRRLVLCLGVALTGLLSMSAMGILSRRVGKELAVFGEVRAHRVHPAYQMLQYLTRCHDPSLLGRPPHCRLQICYMAHSHPTAATPSSSCSHST
jgi:predicted RND superfamily exporter protein